MKDKLFLAWLHDRIASQEGSDVNAFFMHKLRSIVNAMPPEQETAIEDFGAISKPGPLLENVATEQSLTEYLKARGLQP